MTAIVVGYSVVSLVGSSSPAGPVRLDGAAQPRPPTSTGVVVAPPTGSAPVVGATTSASGQDQRPPSWSEVMAALDTLRAEAFERSDVAILTEVYVNGSVPHAADRAALDALTTDGLHAVGLRLEVQAVVPIEVDVDDVVLAVTDRLDPYVLARADGIVAQAIAGRGELTWRVHLAREGGDWQIAEITSCVDRACGD